MEQVFETLRLGFEQLANRQILPQIFDYQFVGYAVIASLIIGPLLGALGTMVLVKRMAFFSQAVGNAALTGVSIGVLLGESPNSPMLSTFGFCILFAILLRYTQGRTSLSNDVLIGVFLSISLALGASMVLAVSAKMNTHVLEALLFGSILTVTAHDLVVLFWVALACTVIGLPLYNRTMLGSISAPLAQVQGVHVRLNDYVFTIMIAALTVACLKIVGAVLVEALLVVPAAAARNISRSLRQFVVWSVVFATLSCLMGILIPMQMDWPLPSGGAIILSAAMFFVLTFLLRNTVGVLRTQGATA